MIAAVVLAAGGSTRMGEPKALLRRPDGRSYVAAIVDTAEAAGCGEVVVVVGPPHGDVIRAALLDIPHARLAVNPRPERGMLSSIQSGLGALTLGVEATLVWPVDIPFVGAATVRAIAGGRGLVIPTHDGRGGHPVRIPRASFAEVLALDPARGLKALMEAHAADVTRLPVADRAVLVDVDTPEDYARTRA
jgi:CTP:molybdopterin cytidylyltransferase MocA